MKTGVKQIELQAKLLNYFLGSNKSNINQSRSLENLISCLDMDLSSDGLKLSQKEAEATRTSAAQICPRLSSLGYVLSEG
jgi:hypothetical protein